jgi:hypothetical protein
MATNTASYLLELYKLKKRDESNKNTENKNEKKFESSTPLISSNCHEDFIDLNNFTNEEQKLIFDVIKKNKELKKLEENRLA